jgi:DNA repair protein RadD
VISPRPYQIEALEALDAHVSTKDTNPCVVIPTGGGKSIIIAWAIEMWKQSHPAFRVCILAHRKELVEQNANEMRELMPFGDIGIYSAGLNKRDDEHSILFASIDSVYKKWGHFKPFDCVIIDEAHRIPPQGEGKYRAFLQGCKKISPHLRAIGFTATPYRMGCGAICHKDHILNEICYDANVGDLIREGYLCKLRSKIGDIQPDLTNVRRNSGGDYIESSLAEATDTDDVVSKAVKSAVEIIGREQRKSVIFFCVSVDHCKHVSNELRKYGIEAPYVTAHTSHFERNAIAEGFKNGRYKALCNVQVYTEGFNAKRIDCIVLLRPTLSRGLYLQMVGRGLRLHESKTECLVLDYAQCIAEHGPIDHIGDTEVRIEICQGCGDVFSRAIRKCPHCGWEIPKKEIERKEAEERARRLHEAQISNRQILGSDPEILAVTGVSVERHRKAGMPDSLCVSYFTGLTRFREWLCFGHGGYAEKRARKRWAKLFGYGEAETVTVDSALQDLFLHERIKAGTKTITIIRRGKYHEIIGFNERMPNDNA